MRLLNNMTTKLLKDKKYSAIILAAGHSTRMRQPKLNLPFGRNQTFVSHLVETYANFGCSEIIVVVNPKTEHLLQEQIPKLPQIVSVINPHPEWPKFHSLQLAIEAMTTLQPTFVQNVDNPFVDNQTLQTLTIELHKGDYIVPTFNNRGGHPFLVTKAVLQKIQQTKDTQTHLKHFLQTFHTIRVPIDNPNILANINSKKDFEQYLGN